MGRPVCSEAKGMNWMWELSFGLFMKLKDCVHVFWSLYFFMIKNVILIDRGNLAVSEFAFQCLRLRCYVSGLGSVSRWMQFFSSCFNCAFFSIYAKIMGHQNPTSEILGQLA